MNSIDPMDIWYSHTPIIVSYVQIHYCDLSKFLGARFEKFREIIYDHHCQMATKEGMFVFEQFFSAYDDYDKPLSFEYQCLVDYLVHKGFTVTPKAHDSEEEGYALVEGTAGCLLNWTW
ncbi:MAG: hypothetical protein [Caudoviricetes sp.]|nr:MAG: hypothetical protein [Caudoviricetes sp.]